MTVTPEEVINTSLHELHVRLSELDRCEGVPAELKHGIRENCFTIASQVRSLPCMPPAPEDGRVL